MSTQVDEDIKTYLTETIFKLYDKDNDGMLSEEEALHFWRALGGNPEKKDVENMFKLTVGDAKEMKCSEFSDYLNTHVKIDKNKEQDELREAFRVFDADGSGYIEKEELRKIMVKCGDEPLSEEELNDLMDKLDANDDNKINYQELISYMFANDNDFADDDEDGEFQSEGENEEGY